MIGTDDFTEANFQLYVIDNPIASSSVEDQDFFKWSYDDSLPIQLSIPFTQFACNLSPSPDIDCSTLAYSLTLDSMTPSDPAN